MKDGSGRRGASSVLDSAQGNSERFGPSRVMQGFGPGDDLGLIELKKVLVEGLHARFTAADVGGELVQLSFEDVSLGDRAAAKDFDGRAPFDPLAGEQQTLTDDRLNRVRQLRKEYLVLGGWEHGDDALDGLSSAGAMNGGENLVPGVGGTEGHPQGFNVAQFADQDDIGVLAQGLAQRLIERRGVGAELHL